MKDKIIGVIVCIPMAILLSFVGWTTIQAKETTTLEEAINRKHSDRDVVVFEDKKHGYICYYRKSAAGISCVPYPYR